MCMKIYGYGIKLYTKDRFNLFDGLLVIISSVDITLEELTGGSTGISIITIFRTFRLLRIFKLASKSESLILLIEAIKDTLLDVAYFSLLLALFIFVSSLVGMDLFAFRIKINNLEE